MAWQVVIAGGGFGGFYAARALERLLPAQSAHVTLVNEANFMLYTPLLPGAAGGTLDPRHVVVPLRSQLRRTDLVIGAVTGADHSQATLGVRRIDGEQLELCYDQLIIALGSVSRTLPIPGLAEHAIGLKSLPDATALRNQVLNCLDIAESVEDRARRAEYLGFVFVGAGYAGVEGLAELQDFAAQAIELYPRCRAQGMRWVLVEARPRIMQEVPDSLAQFAERELRARGIEVRTDTTLRELTARAATLSDGETIAARTLVWTAGVKPSPVVARLALPLDREGRIVADETMRVDHRAHAAPVWAIGDCAAVPDASRPGQSCPPTAQHAIRQGRLVARNVAASLAGGRARPFRYRTKGVVAELGRNQAVAITLGIRWRGLSAWLIARTYHLLLMPGLGRRLRLLADWNVALVFGRDPSSPGRLGSPTPLADE
ncbi:MAG TPA: NAD(P)/FAD-dependent oxidoreductase [Solirubrobacteraceae bacterium]|nr:NAD(P)/FAD-dependent oxidoreductase [Solirubrobacteraceae bacterium]HLM87389.1 NAD(P)/FAD-dependent oxidoreductase [Solirubrobacteraceae bacterium]